MHSSMHCRPCMSTRLLRRFTPRNDKFEFFFHKYVIASDSEAISSLCIRPCIVVHACRRDCFVVSLLAMTNLSFFFTNMSLRAIAKQSRRYAFVYALSSMHVDEIASSFHSSQ